MERRKFGNTSLEVSAISLGCWIFGVDWWGHYTDERSARTLQFSYDQGITFFDNGDAYGNGRAETVFGNLLKNRPVAATRSRSAASSATTSTTTPAKPGATSERKQDFSPKFMRFSPGKIAQRLGTDYIDLYMAHNIKLPQFRDDLFAELEKVKDEGKIKVWGVSLGPAIGWREEGVKAIIEHGAKAVQTVYNMFEQNPGREFCETAVANHAGVLARVHDNSSILKDIVKIDTTIGENDHRKFRDQAWKIYGLKKLELVRHYATDHGMTVHQLACKWLLQQPGLTSITGTLLNEHEIQEAAESVDKPNLSMQELRQIAEDYARDWGLGAEPIPATSRAASTPAAVSAAATCRLR